MIIRQATTEDAKAIQTLLHDTWKDTYGDHLSQETLDEVHKNWQSIEFLTKQIQNPDFYFPVAIENEVVGIATARNVDCVTIMFRLYVHPKQQRKSIGQQLLQQVIHHFPQNKKVQIHVEVLNQKGQSFYKKQGFKETKREEEKIVNEIIEQILMEKDLPESSS
jgi:diamine N-acetyltransferase